MKDFDNSFLALISSESSIAFWCIDLQIDAASHQYFTDLDIDIVHDGNRYQTSEFKVMPVNYGMSLAVDKIDLEFSNVDLNMSATLLNNTITGQPCIIYAGAMDGSGTYANLLKYSEQFDHADWTKDDLTVTANAVYAPDGTLTADKLIQTAVSAQHRIKRAIYGLTLGQNVNFSTYVKAAEYGNDIEILAWNGSDGIWLDATANLSDGTISGTNAAIEYVGNGWYRISVSGAPALEQDNTFFIYPRASVSTGDGTSGIYAWGAQLTQGENLRPYIKAESTTVTKESFYIEEVFRGLSSDWSLDENVAKISVVDELVYWNKRSLRKPDALCSWEFKGTECGYSGASTSCNRTYARCQALSNSDSFSGFRYFPATEEKSVWWGKTS